MSEPRRCGRNPAFLVSAPALTTALLTALLAGSLAGPLAAQTPFKGEVDGLIRFFRNAAHDNHALGDGTCRHTAKVLTAMGYSHRGYLANAGPYTRNPLRFLFTRRQADGSFANLNDQDPTTTTMWVIDALRVLGPDLYRAEIRSGEDWLAQRGAKKSAFAELRADGAKLREIAQAVSRGPIEKDGKPDMAANVDALLMLVRGQYDTRHKKTGTRPAWSGPQQKGLEFLMTKQDDGRFYMLVPVGEATFMKHYDLGVTGMALAALQTKPAAMRSPAEQKVIDSGLQWIAESQNDMGGFGQRNVNYTTCAAVMALHKAGREEYQPMLKKAQRFIKALQNTEERGYADSDRDYGSIGYGGDERGDLSNTQFAIQALKETGLDAQDEAFAKAIVFLQRTQNRPGTYKGKTRDPKSGKPVPVKSGSDGGAAYYPGNSPAGYIELPDGTKIPRSYGSMTYALLKTYTLCGVEKDDPRLQAAVRWIGLNFDLDTNPGADPRLGEKAKYQGLYYYYMVMAQALDAADIDQLMVHRGKTGNGEKLLEPLDWRAALRAKITGEQNDSGGWLNEKNGRWWEESDLICTCYAMLALEHCQ